MDAKWNDGVRIVNGSSKTAVFMDTQ